MHSSYGERVSTEAWPLVLLPVLLLVVVGVLLLRPGAHLVLDVGVDSLQHPLTRVLIGQIRLHLKHRDTNTMFSLFFLFFSGVTLCKAPLLLAKNE